MYIRFECFICKEASILKANREKLELAMARAIMNTNELTKAIRNISHQTKIMNMSEFMQMMTI